MQAAQFAAAAGELDRLLHDRLVFTGVDGLLYWKEDDLDIQRGGEQRLTQVSGAAKSFGGRLARRRPRTQDPRPG
ncbi:hypothetical protein [Pseudofrankia sp. DC12]|uniref:hypothetical protein n=1 Tax=Pseudofrankia sp. DC12 TaxID=683315 RepID=UPI0012FA5FF2|nr:hypothetical protein [Pseudofrankia sp. DC12]